MPFHAPMRALCLWALSPCFVLAAPPIVDHPAYAVLLASALRTNPGLQRLEALREAEKARVPQAGALPDPELSLGIQRKAAMDVTVPNPVMEDMPLMGTLPSSTEYSLMATQSLPWPRKREMRTAMAQAGLRRQEAELAKGRMDLEAQVQEGLLAWLRLDAERKLQAEQERLWAPAVEGARRRLEVGQGSQSDLIQALMARTRLAQRQLELEAQAENQRSALERLAGLSLEGLPLATALDALPRPQRPELAVAQEDAQRRSPEWAASQGDLDQSEKALNLGRLDLRPDLRFTAGLMKEPGMGTGWKAEVGFALPVFSSRKQRQVVGQRQAEHRAAGFSRAELKLNLEQSLRERLRIWELGERQLRLFDEALLPQGELAVQSLLAQFEGGRTSFSAVLEAFNSQLKDHTARLDLLHRLHRLSVAQERVSLESPVSGGSAMEGGSLPASRLAPMRSSGSSATAMPTPSAPAAPVSMSM